MAEQLLIAVQDGATSLAISERSYHLLRSRPDFPKPVRISPRCVRWRVDDLREWVRRLPEVDRLAEPPHLRDARS